MFTIPGFQTTEQLYESDGSIIYRAIREREQRPVVLKVLKAVRPPPETIARFKREYQLTKELDLPGVIEVLDLVQTENHWVIVTEDFGAESLRRLELAGRISVERALELGVTLAGIIGAIHDKSVIHKDINPANIVLDPTSDTVKLIDFGISTRQIPEETVSFEHPTRLEGTPGYMSPEQTGRINRSLDYRTDFYSLGCTLYELLTGRRPFDSDDLIELIHCHLAHVPTPPHDLRSDVPRSLSAIILKLLDKDPDKRYQTGAGLAADLAECSPERGEQAALAFDLGRSDTASRFRLPAKLYGRAEQVERLLQTFDRVRQGQTHLTMVAGYSGIGKSALVKQLYEPITERRGFFVTGKFGQFERNIPYAAVIQAFNALIQQVLCEGEASVSRWREHLMDAIGPSCSALAEIVPQLELVVGPMPPPPTLSPGDAQFRLMRAMSAFVRAFARHEHPLVLFLDDLQWADGGSLDFIKNLTVGEGLSYLLILGAYRDNEISPGHPLVLVLEDIPIVETLTLAPLEVAHVAEFVADTLYASLARVAELAELIHGKTGGNPFFIGQFLTTFHADSLFRFDHETRQWTWDMPSIRARNVSDNVVELVLDNLHKLEPETREVLRLAAFVGGRFDLSTLAIISELPAARVATALMPAIADSFVMPLSGNYRLFEANVNELEQRVEVSYKFLHDRIQQAAYALTSEADEQATHLHIGRRLSHERPDALLDYINHLNAANALISDSDERLATAQLDQHAGRKAKDSAAYQEALQYFSYGLSFLWPSGTATNDSIVCADANVFAQNYQLSLELTGEAAEMAYITGDMITMEKLAASGLENARSWEDKVKIYQVMLKALTDQGRAFEALEMAHTILEALGVAMPKHPTQADVDEAFAEIDKALQGRSIEDLASLPAAVSSRLHSSAMQILDSMRLTTYITRRELRPIVSTRMVQLTMAHGYTQESLKGFLSHGINLCGAGKLEQGIQFGQLARTFCAQTMPSKEQVAELNANGYYNVFHWKEPIRELIGHLKDGYITSLESGGISAAINCLTNTAMAPFVAGFELGELAEYMRQTVAVGEQLGQDLWVRWVQTYQQCALNLMGEGEDPCTLEGRAFSERERMPEFMTNNDQLSIELVYVMKTLLYCRFGRYREAIATFVTHVEGRYPASGVLYPPTVMYYCLAEFALCPTQETEERTVVLENMRRRRDEMKRWAALCPANYAHKYHLVEAELARVEGKFARARDHYDLAIDLAREHLFLNEESLALEHAALCFRQQGRERLASYYLRDAHYVYQRWGAIAKQEELERRFPDLLSQSSTVESSTLAKPSALTTGQLFEFDLQTVLRASRAIRSEREHGRLLEQIMSICVAHTGARRGALLLTRGDDLVIKAKGEFTDQVQVSLVSEALEMSDSVPRTIVRYTAKTLESVILDDATQDGLFKNDPYIRTHACRSVLCLPLLLQRMLVGITYMENNETSDAFNADRLEILDLLMAQAAVSIENARLRQVDEGTSFEFAVGGSLASDTPSYVLRDADRELLERVEYGEYCYVFNARQMGKSSLRVQTMARLVDRGVRCATIDITSIGSTGIGVEQWYAGIARSMISGLGLQREFNLGRWWRDHVQLSPVQRLAELVDGVVLKHIEEPVAIFIDEIDMVLSFEFALDDFFALIRYFYNKRADDPRYSKLAFVFLGVATPTDLVQDKTKTPFNIGHAVRMTGFRYNEARILTRGLTDFADPDAILDAILTWTEGQPFLSQKLCHLAQQSESRPALGTERDWVAALVRDRVIDRWRMRDDPEHLKTIEARILHSSNRSVFLSLYQQIWKSGGIPAVGTPAESELLLSGLVVREWGRLRSANPIYASVFDAAWLQDHEN